MSSASAIVMSLLLIRHGETALNVSRTFQPADTPLNPHGEEQARLLAARLRPIDLAAVLCSDLPRAMQTAAAVAHARGLEPEISPLLQERNFGDWRGRPWDEITGAGLTLENAPPQGESRADFVHRVARAFAWVVRRRAELGRPVAVVTHGLVIDAFLVEHLTLSVGQVHPEQVGNTSLSIFDADPPHTVSLLACRLHLDPPRHGGASVLSGG